MIEGCVSSKLRRDSSGALPSFHQADLICIHKLQQNHALILSARIVPAGLMTMWGKKKEKRKRKMLRKDSKRGENDEREREKRH